MCALHRSFLCFLHSLSSRRETLLGLPCVIFRLILASLTFVFQIVNSIRRCCVKEIAPRSLMVSLVVRSGIHAGERLPSEKESFVVRIVSIFFFCLLSSLSDGFF